MRVHVTEEYTGAFKERIEHAEAVVSGMLASIGVFRSSIEALEKRGGRPFIDYRCDALDSRMGVVEADWEAFKQWQSLKDKTPTLSPEDMKLLKSRIEVAYRELTYSTEGGRLRAITEGWKAVNAVRNIVLGVEDP